MSVPFSRSDRKVPTWLPTGDPGYAPSTNPVFTGTTTHTSDAGYQNVVQSNQGRISCGGISITGGDLNVAGGAVDCNTVDCDTAVTCATAVIGLNGLSVGGVNPLAKIRSRVYFTNATLSSASQLTKTVWSPIPFTHCNCNTNGGAQVVTPLLGNVSTIADATYWSDVSGNGITFTVPTGYDGLYRINANVMFNFNYAGDSGQDMDLRLFKTPAGGGSEVILLSSYHQVRQGGAPQSAAMEYLTARINDVVYLTAGDQVYLKGVAFWYDSSTNVYFDGGNATAFPNGLTNMTVEQL